ncbi:MAG: hypothetical protein HFJ48_01155 [Clostridia bacterium]|nr:hypothetical protein [Clostridia bacterium]
MKIGIDIDDTAFITVNSMIKYADKFDAEELGRKGINGDFGLIQNRYYLKALYGWNEKEKFNFFDMYYKNVLEECVLMPNADKVCKKLKDEGDILYFITARLTNIKNCNTEEITKESLLKNNIDYDELIVNASDKIKITKEKEIDLFIEDSYETCVELEKIGVKSILMTTRMNKDINSGSITRVHNWDELYEQIKNIKLKI